MKKIITLIIAGLLICSCMSTAFAGKMIIKNNVLVKYKPSKMLNSYYPKPEYIDKLVIPEGVTTIGPNAFSDWAGKINIISLPSSLKYINPEGIFQQIACEVGGFYGEPIHLEKIIVDSKNKTYCSEDGVLFSKDKTKLIYYPDLKKDRIYTIPSSVLYIPKNAFPVNSYFSQNGLGDEQYFGHIYLKELIIPLNVKRLASSSINSLNLEKLTIENPNIIIEEKAFCHSFWYEPNEDYNTEHVKTILKAPENVKQKYFYPYEYDEWAGGILSFAVFNGYE